MSQSSSSKAEGFLLLTIPNVKLSAPFISPPEQTGLLSLECVSIPLSQTDSKESIPFVDGGPDRDIWLVIRLNKVELPLSATDPIRHSRINRTFTFKAREGMYMVTIPLPSNSAESEDLETFEVLLAQYGMLQEMDPEKGGDDRDMKGRLVLVDEEDGEVVGTLGDQFTIKEDPDVARNDKSPVIIEMPEEGQHELRVHAINPDEQDYILRSAQFISEGIITATDVIGKGLGMAAGYYVKNTKPNEEPMVFSEATQTNLRRIHRVSGLAVQVTARTTGLIHSLIDYASDRVAGVPKEPHRSAAYAPGQTPPRLPSRGGERNGFGERSRSATGSPAPSGSQQPPALPPRKRVLNRLLMSTNLLLTTLENSAQSIVVNATDSLSTGLGHKYGPDMGAAVRTVGDTVRNVGVVYIDARGFGRRALIKRAGKRVIKGRMGKREVVFGGDQMQDDGYMGMNREAGGSSDLKGKYD